MTLHTSLGSKRLELIQWRVRALDRIKRRVAGQIPGFSLSCADAAIYVGLIEARCKRVGLLVIPTSKALLSVLSGPLERVNSKSLPPLNQREGNEAGLPPLLSHLQVDSYPTQTTEGATYPTEPTQGED